MTVFTMRTEVTGGFDATVSRVRELLADAGFGILTEIDLKATLADKLGVDIPDQLILGACRPDLAHAAVNSDPRIAALLPCNVVVADAGSGRIRVEVLDPKFMTSVSEAEGLGDVASDARERLEGMLKQLTS